MPAHSSEAFSQWSLDRVALGLDSTTSRDGIGMVAHIFNPIDVEAGESCDFKASLDCKANNKTPGLSRWDPGGKELARRR